MEAILQAFETADQTFSHVYIGILRYAAPLLILIILFRGAKPLLTFRREPEIWAWLKMGKNRLAVTHWENVIGRSKQSDLVIDFPTVSRNHAVLTRYDDGSWTVSDAASKSGVFVNGRRKQICAVGEGDTITVGGVDMELQPISARQEAKLAELRTRAGTLIDGIANVLLLTVLQTMCALAFLLVDGGENGADVILGFGGIMLCQWLLVLFYGLIHRGSFELETIAFLLCTMGMAGIMTVDPGEAVKQLCAIALGLIAFLLVGWSLRNLERAKRFRYLAAAAGIGFLVVTLIFGQEYYGAKNWLSFGPLSVQPSEFSKVCFVYTGASTMDRIMNKRNLTLFIGYSAAMCGCLALMNDFGTALIFFCAFLVIAFLRSGSVGTVALAIAALVFAGIVAIRIAPHALRRFATWRHIWENPLDGGYQQTRALMCMASGGLFGLGPGQGWMENVFAADSDMIFATLGEEWGLITVIMLVLCVAAIGIFAMRCAAVARSSFYTIGACTAAGILLVQVVLNALGTVDVVPLTGVTFPFLSNGGSSMVCAWGLLAFIKAADTRQNASFAVRLTKRGVSEDE